MTAAQAGAIALTGTAGYDISGNLLFANSGDSESTFRGIQGLCGSNDYWRVGGRATANNAGYMEIATADDGTEPIYVRQYTGVYSTLTRTATLLDGSGNTSFPGVVSASRLTLSSINDVDPGSYNSPALTIGAQTSEHIEIDTNEIVAKSNANTPSTLYLGEAGGQVQINGCNLNVGTSLSVSTGATIGTSLSAGTLVTAAQGLRVTQTDGTQGYGLTLYGSASPQTYGIYFAKTSTFGTHGGVTSDWATYFGMNSGATTRGWIFRREDGCVASVSGSGTITGASLVSSGGLDVASTASFHGQINMNNGMQWKAPGNITCIANGSNKECSFDVAAGVQWHVWSTPHSKSMISCLADSGFVEVPFGNFGVGNCRLQYDSSNQCLNFTFV